MDKANQVYEALTARRWAYDVPDYNGTNVHVHVVMTEKEILCEYWPYWRAAMLRSGFSEDQLTEEDCLFDWITVNWAERVD
jgi:hypothetical protein